MPAPDSSLQVHFPDTLNDLMHLRREMPDALIYAGGTYILKSLHGPLLTLPEKIISLQEVEELDRISRTEKHLEVGAMVTVKKLLMIGRHVVPSALFDALLQVAPAGIKNLATLGGNICVAERNMTTAPVLQLMDAALELRHHGSSRWVQASRFRLPDGRLDLRDGDVLTRVRVPLDNWNVQFFRRFGTEYSPETNPLSFCGLARIDKSIVEDVRIAFCSAEPGLIRDREIEADIAGRKLPISERDTATLLARYEDSIGNAAVQLDDFQRKRAIRLAGWFLNRLADE